MKAHLEAAVMNHEAQKNQLEAAQLLKFQALAERDKYIAKTSALQQMLMDNEEVFIVAVE